MSKVKGFLKHITFKNMAVLSGVVVLLVIINFTISNYSLGYNFAYADYAKKDKSCNSTMVNFFPKSRLTILVDEKIKLESKNITRYSNYELGKKGNSLLFKVKLSIRVKGALSGMEDYFKECYGV